MKNVVMLVGAAGSGKDTAAEAIMKAIPSCADVKFASVLKQTCCLLFGWDLHKLTHDLEYKQEEAFYPDGEPVRLTEDGRVMTRRDLMQYLGTDLFRNQVRDDIWVRSAIAEMERIEARNGPPTLWVLTDTRFQNEFDLMESEADNLLVIQLQREDHEIEEASHESEQGWKHFPAHEVIICPSGHTEALGVEAVDLARAFLRDL